MQSNHGVFHLSNTVTQRNLKHHCIPSPTSQWDTPRSLGWLQSILPSRHSSVPLLMCMSVPWGHIYSRCARKDRNMREGFPIIFASQAPLHMTTGQPCFLGRVLHM